MATQKKQKGTPAPRKRATKKQPEQPAAAPAKKTAVKKQAKKKVARAKAAPRVPRSKEQLKAAKESRMAMLPEAIKVGRKALQAWSTNGSLTAAVKNKLGGHPLAGDLDDSDWRNLALRVRRQFSRQAGVMEVRRKRPLPANQQKVMASHEVDASLKGGTQWRITEGASPEMEQLKRQYRGASKAKKAKGKKGKAPTAEAQQVEGNGGPKKRASKKAAPRKRAAKRAPEAEEAAAEE
jgi:hypothetical protein